MLPAPPVPPACARRPSSEEIRARWGPLGHARSCRRRRGRAAGHRGLRGGRAGGCRRARRGGRRGRGGRGLAADVEPDVRRGHPAPTVAVAGEHRLGVDLPTTCQRGPHLQGDRAERAGRDHPGDLVHERARADALVPPHADGGVRRPRCSQGERGRGHPRGGDVEHDGDLGPVDRLRVEAGHWCGPDGLVAAAQRQPLRAGRAGTQSGHADEPRRAAAAVTPSAAASSRRARARPQAAVQHCDHRRCPFPQIRRRFWTDPDHSAPRGPRSWTSGVDQRPTDREGNHHAQ